MLTIIAHWVSAWVNLICSLYFQHVKSLLKGYLCPRIAQICPCNCMHITSHCSFLRRLPPAQYYCKWKRIWIFLSLFPSHFHRHFQTFWPWKPHFKFAQVSWLIYFCHIQWWSQLVVCTCQNLSTNRNVFKLHYNLFADWTLKMRGPWSMLDFTKPGGQALEELMLQWWWRPIFCQLKELISWSPGYVLVSFHPLCFGFILTMHALRYMYSQTCL